MEPHTDFLLSAVSFIAENTPIFVVAINAIAASLIWWQIKAHNTKAGFEAAVKSFELSDRMYERWLSAVASHSPIAGFYEGQVAALLELEAFQINKKKLSKDVAEFYADTLISRTKNFVEGSDYFEKIDFQRESEGAFEELRGFVAREDRKHRELDAVKSALGMPA